MKILFTGGGSAGHIFPILAIVREMKRIHPQEDLKLFYMGPRDDFIVNLKKEGVRVKTILTGKIRRYITFQGIVLNIIDIFIKIPVGFLQSFFLIFFIAPDVILSKGGYGSVPVVFSGWVLGARIFLHESDITPGLANRLTVRTASEIFVSFPKTEYFQEGRIMCVGNPIRKEVTQGSEEKARKIFTLTGEKPVILVLGGSQGAQRINDMLLLILPKMLTEFEVIHQCGKRNFTNVTAESKVVINEKLEKYYHLVAFLEEQDLAHAYSIADIIVSRAGASHIFEIAAVGKPSLLIPLPESAQNHQSKNAYAYAEHEAAMVFEEAGASSAHFFLERLQYLISRPRYLRLMGEVAKDFSRPQAASIIASYIIEYLSS